MRYMFAIFQLASLLFVAQLFLAVRNAKASLAPAEASLMNRPMIDVCSLLSQDIALIVPTCLVMAIAYVLRRGNSVYLLDFSLYDPPASWRVGKEQILEI